MGTLKVTSNYKRRTLMSWNDIPPKERPELDFGADPDVEGQYFEAYGQWWKLDDFTLIRRTGEAGGPFAHYVAPESPLAKWEYIATESAFHGIVIRVNCDDYDNEHVVAGWAQDLS